MNMFAIVIICSAIATIAATSDYSYGNNNGGQSNANYGQNSNYGNSYGYETYDNKPMPYSFGYDTKDHYGTQLTRSETGDGYGLVRGSYSYSTGHGISRLVEYEADHNGFRAKVKTNEPGVQRSYPAHVEMLGPETAWAEQRIGYNNYGSNYGSSNYGNTNYGTSDNNYQQQSYNSQATKQDSNNDAYGQQQQQQNLDYSGSYNTDYNYASTQQKAQSIELPKQTISGKMAVIRIN